jgi:hypothetical protein
MNMNIGMEFFENLKFDNDSLKRYRLESAHKCAETLGDKPALCLSGGIDSQAMVQSFYDAGYDFDVFTLVFNDDLNIHDASHARLYAEKNNIKLHEIDINILTFLSRENQDYAVKYNSYSPHFNTHFKLFDILRSKGYTSVVAGGNTPCQLVDSNDRLSWGGGYGRNSLSFIKYSQISNFLCQGCYLSYYPELAWATTILTPITYHYRTLSHVTWAEVLKTEKERYKDKVIGYQRAGFDVIPQETKYTGFELVKKYYEERSGDGWYFEKNFRFPLEKLLKADMYGLPEIFIEPEIRNKLYSLYLDNMLPGRLPPRVAIES